MTPTGHNGILRQVLDLPNEQKALLLVEILQQELNSSMENNSSFLKMLDDALTRLAARMGSEAMSPEHPAGVQGSVSRHRPDPRPAMEWLRLRSKDYGGQWVALDGDRLIAHGPDAQEVYDAARADGAYLPLIDYIEPAEALSFVF